MRIVQDIDKKEKNKLLEELYSSFETGYDFEIFLKPFLEELGLTEVFVTKKSGDGGIDLTAIKPGLVELDGNDVVNYKIQAKRYSPEKTINPEKIDALRGNLAFNEKGLFITTAKVSEKAKMDAFIKDLSKPVIVIDGLRLIDICIEHQIGFAYKPIFSKSALNEFLKPVTQDIKNEETIDTNLQYVSKKVSFNDIRSRIISIPTSILSKMSNNKIKHSVNIIINGTEKVTVTFFPGRNYLASVTSIFKKYGFIKEDGATFEKMLEWAIDDSQILHINIRNSD